MKCPQSPDSFGFLAPVGEVDDEAQKIEAAICKARKMARQCSLQEIGTYQPYDAADPTTWDRSKKGKAKKRRDSTGCASTSSSTRSSMQQEFSAKSSEMVTPSSHKKDGRASSPISSAFKCDELYFADCVEQDDRKVEDGSRGGRLAGHRSHSPSRKSSRKKENGRRSGRLSGHRSHSPSSKLSGKKERRSRRVPIVETGELMEQFVHDVPQDKSIEEGDMCMNRMADSSATSPSWWNEDTPNATREDLNVRQVAERSPGSRKGSSGEAYDSYQSLAICSQAAKEKENYASMPSFSDTSVLHHLELKEKMLQERLLETKRKLFELSKEKALVPHDVPKPTTKSDLRRSVTTSEQEGMNSKTQRRRRSYTSSSYIDAPLGTDAMKVKRSVWGIRRQSNDV